MRINRGLLFVLLCLCSSLWSKPSRSAPSGNIPSSQIVLSPGSTQDYEITSGATQDFALRLPPGKISTVTFQQTESTIRIRTSEETSSDADAHVNLGGRLTSIVFHAAGLHAPVDGLVLFIVENKTRRPAKFHLTASVPRTPAAADYTAAQAEEESALALAASKSPDTVRQSLPVFESAEADWRTLNEPAALAQILSVHAFTQAFVLNDQAAALKLLSELLPLAATLATAQPAQAADAHKVAAFINANLAHYDEAFKQYGEALSLFETTGDLFNRVVMLENRSKIERIQGDNSRALADVEAALPIARQNRDQRGEEALEVERGDIAYESGQLGPAYESELRALTLSQSAGFLEGEAWSALGLIYLDLHDYEQSARSFDHAEAIWKQTPNILGQLATRENRAELRLAQGDISGARAVFEAGVEEAKAHGLTREHIAFLHGVAASDMRSGKFSAAETLLHQATDEAAQSQVTDEISTLYAATGDLYAAQDHWEQAAQSWQQADEAAQKRGHNLDRSIALGGLARAALHLNKLDEAHAYCQEGMTALESVRSQINDNDLRLSFFSSRHVLYDLCVQIDIERNDQESAFTSAERSRARTLLDQAVSSGIQPNIPEAFLARMTANQQSLSDARKALNPPAPRGGPRDSPRNMDKPHSEAKLAHRDAEIQPLLEQRAQLRQEAQQNGYDIALSAAAMPFTEREVAQHLDPDTALIAFWAGSQKSYIWLVTQAGTLVKTLPPSSTLDARVRQYLDLLSESIPATANGSAAEQAAAIARIQAKTASDGASLRRLLLPFAIPPTIKRLLLVKDGALLSLSFATLPGTPSVSAPTYLTTRYELADEPSATFAFRIPVARQAVSPAKIVAFIDPSANTTRDRAANPSGPNPSNSVHRVSLPRGSGSDTPSPDDSASDFPSWTSPLPYAREEARILQETFGSQNATIFTGPAATRAQVLSLDWSSYSLAHFAAHAIYRKTHPELSGIVLSPAGTPQKPAAAAQKTSNISNSISPNSDPPSTDLLSFSDVLRMKTPPPLVVLSACSSGIGSFVPGEGMLALNTAFLASGSSQVVSTLWPVDDQASSVFMREFYHAFATTHSAIESMQRAQRSMATSREWSAPYYWGAFTLSGDWHDSRNPLPAQP